MDSALSQLSREELITLLLAEKQKAVSYEASLKEWEMQVLEQETKHQSSLQTKQQEIDYLKSKVSAPQTTYWI